MPTYDYTCDACNHAWELFQSMNDNAVRKCPSCGKLKARRLIGSGAGLIFKGSGFYVTDYKKSGTSSRSSSESSPSESSSPANCGNGACQSTGTCQGSATAPSAASPKEAAPKTAAKSKSRK